MACSLLVLLLIITRATDQTYLLWIGYGVFSSFGTLVYPQASAAFDPALSGLARENTTWRLHFHFAEHHTRLFLNHGQLTRNLFAARQSLLYLLTNRTIMV